MDDKEYILTDTYFGNSINENVTITNNEYAKNSEENFSNSQSEHEVDIKDLLISKYQKRNEISNQKPKLDINTMESIRISHSFERSQSSQSLTQIINQPFILIQKNTNDDSCYNQTIKFKNSCNSMEIESSSKTNKSFYYNDNNNDKNSLISIKDKKRLKNNHILVLNKDFFNKNKSNQNKNGKDNNYIINNNCIKRFKIGNIFKEIFEERIKSNKLSKNDSFKKNDSANNKDKIKQKLLGYKNKENYYLSLFDSDKYSSSYTIKSSNNKVKEKEKEKELTLEINNSNKEKYLKDKLIDLNNISNIDNINEYSIKNQEKLDNLKNKNKYSIKEKKNHIILYPFENENKNKNEDDYNKNVMISELDIKISKKLPEEENKNNNSPNKKTEIPKRINNECAKEKYAIINKKTLNTDFNKNKRKLNNNNKYIYKKTFKFDKIPGNKICSYKNIKKINKNFKSSINIKGKKVYNFENDKLKKYKINNSFSNHNTNKKSIIKKQNNLNTLRSICSFFTLNTTILNRTNMNNRTITARPIRKNYSRYLNTSSSLPKNKKIKAHYLNYLSKKNNLLSKNTHVNQNKYFNKKDNENNINQNNDIKEKTSTNIIENRSRLFNYIKLLKINSSFFTKMNRTKDFTIFTKNNNSHFNKIMNNSHKKNSFKNDKINSKKKEFLLYNINKDMMLFKRKINRIKNPALYSNNTKILKRKNFNNLNLKEKLFGNQNDQNNQNEPSLFKNDIKIKSIDNVSTSFTQNINLYNYKKSINNINNNCSNSLLLTNINNNKNLLNPNKNIKSKENIIANFKHINKYNTYNINHFTNFKDSKNKTNKKNKKRKIINDNKFTNKTNITYIKNKIENNNLLNIKTIKKNASELKYKINNILKTIDNNSHNNIPQKDKYPFSCRNKIKKNLNFKL